MPPALAGGLLATGPLGKSLNNFLKLHRISCKKMLAPWEKRYDQPEQHIKKQRRYFANKGLSSQNCGFSSSHVTDLRVGL